MRVELSRDRVVAIGKHLRMPLSHGEYAGVSLLRPDAARVYNEISTGLEWSAQTTLYYEDVYALMIERKVDTRAAAVQPGEYAEVDTPEGLAGAAGVIDRHVDACPRGPGPPRTRDGVPAGPSLDASTGRRTPRSSSSATVVARHRGNVRRHVGHGRKRLAAAFAGREAHETPTGERTSSGGGAGLAARTPRGGRRDRARRRGPVPRRRQACAAARAGSRSWRSPRSSRMTGSARPSRSCRGRRPRGEHRRESRPVPSSSRCRRSSARPSPPQLRDRRPARQPPRAERLVARRRPGSRDARSTRVDCAVESSELIEDDVEGDGTIDSKDPAFSDAPRRLARALAWR